MDVCPAPGIDLAGLCGRPEVRATGFERETGCAQVLPRFRAVHPNKGERMARNYNLAMLEALLEKGVSQVEMGFDLRIDATLMSKIIRGWRQPTPEQRKKIASYLGKSESELFDHNKGVSLG
jgi:ribosome-binding protein aMBF1 (putative translation factor)